MAAPVEVIVSSDSGSQLWNVSVLDLHSGSSLLSYRGGNSAARGLTLLAGRYLLSAQLAKNFINVWEIQRKVGWRGRLQARSTKNTEQDPDRLVAGFCLNGVFRTRDFNIVYKH